MNNKIESIKSVVKTIETCYNDIDEIKQIIPNNKTNISFMFDKYGEWEMSQILDVYLSTTNKDLKIMLDVIIYLEKININELSKIGHSYSEYSTYSERLKPLITEIKINQHGGKL